MEKYMGVDDYKNLWTIIRQFTSQLESEPPDCVVDGIQFPPGTDDVIKHLRTFNVREDDVWIMTYMKTGTTWIQEIVSCLIYDGDLEEVNKQHTAFRVLYIDVNLPEKVMKAENLPPMHDIITELPSPRVIKTHLRGHHLPPQLMEKKPKILSVLRNPKDLAVSYFYFIKEVHPTPGTVDMSFDEFLQKMLTGEVIYGPWWTHYLYIWNRRHELNTLVLKFEDLKKDLRRQVQKIAEFIGRNLPQEKLDAITEHCTFDSMKTNQMANLGYVYYDDNSPHNFMRKGKVGDWRNHFTVAQNEAMDAHIRDKLEGSGLSFDYD